MQLREIERCWRRVPRISLFPHAQPTLPRVQGAVALCRRVYARCRPVYAAAKSSATATLGPELSHPRPTPTSRHRQAGQGSAGAACSQGAQGWRGDRRRHRGAAGTEVEGQKTQAQTQAQAALLRSASPPKQSRSARCAAPSSVAPHPKRQNKKNKGSSAPGSCSPWRAP